MRLNYRYLLAAFPLLAVVGCGGAGDAKTVGDAVAQPMFSQTITVHTVYDDTVVAFQNGDKAWQKLAPSGDTHTFTANVTKVGGKYGIAFLRTSQNEVVVYQLATTDGTSVTQPLKTASGADTRPRQTFAVQLKAGQESSMANDRGIATTAYSDTTSVNLQPRMGSNADAIGLINKIGMFDSTTDKLPTGSKMMVFRGLTPGGPAIPFKGSTPGAVDLLPYDAKDLFSAIYYTGGTTRAYLDLPKQVASPTHILAPATAGPGDRMVLMFADSAGTSQSNRNCELVVTNSASYPTAPTYAPAIDMTSLKVPATNTSTVEFKFNAPADATSFQFAAMPANIQFHVSPAFLGGPGTVTYVTPDISNLTLFKKFFTGANYPSYSFNAMIRYYGGGFLDTPSDQLSALSLAQFGPDTKYASSYEIFKIVP